MVIEFIVGKNCGPTTLFRDLLECLLVDEENETGRYIFSLCFPIGLADTGRPPREQGGGGGADELGRQETSINAGPQGALPSQQKMEGRDEGKHSFHFSIGYCFQKLDELVKNGNCSYPHRGRRWRSMVRCGAVGRPADKNGYIIRHNIACATLLFTYSSMKVMKQDSSFSVFVFLWLRSMWMDRT